jgi:hypothetical protein
MTTARIQPCARLTILFATSLLVTARASADDHRLEVRAVSGVTFGTKTASTYGVGFAYRLTNRLGVTAELGRMRDIKNGAFMSYVGTNRRAWGRSVEAPYVFDASLRAWYGVVGPRFEAGRRVRLHLEALGGAAILSGDTYLSPWRWNPPPSYRFPDAGHAAVDNGQAHPLVAGGAGLAVRINELVSIDAGFRRGRVFLDDHFMDYGDGGPFAFNHGYGAVRFSF